MTNTITRDLVIATADQEQGQMKGGFLPRSTGYEEGRDLDGTHAHLFLQGLGFTCWGHHDTGRFGVAYTACGLVLSTNGFIVRDFERADRYRAGGR